MPKQQTVVPRLAVPALLARLASREGVEHAELADDTRERRLSFSDGVNLRSSYSRSDPSVSHSIGVLELELPDTVLAIESFLRWWPSGVIRRRKRDSLLPPLVRLSGSIRQESSKASSSSMMGTDSNHLLKRASRSIE